MAHDLALEQVRRMTRLAGPRQAFALLAAACLWAAPAQAQFFPFWGQPAAPRQQPAPPPQLSTGQVRAALAQEGARLIGAPRRRGREIVAIGRDDDGARKRFTLDAVSGEVLDITVIARPVEAPPPAPGDAIGPSDAIGPGEPLPPPDHAPQEAIPAAPAAPAGRGPTVAVSPSGAPGSAAPPSKADPADASLSPIKPLKPAPGAPRVEPLPK
jgi:hypothetical protein